MERILNFLDKSTNGKCYKSFKYSLDDLEVPSLIYDDKPKIVLQPKAETDKRKQKYILSSTYKCNFLGADNKQ